MLIGNTLFLGDSMTVGLSPFVQVDGVKKTVAEVNRTSAWLLGQVQQLQAQGALSNVAQALVLIGANDLNGGPSAASVAGATIGVWDILRGSGCQVIGMSLPPDKGWAPFASNFANIEIKRKAINSLLGQAFVNGRADAFLDLSTLMADESDPAKLSPAFDSGDHLHPKKDAFGALINRALDGRASPPASKSQGASPLGLDARLEEGATSMKWALFLGVSGILGYMLTRKYGLKLRDR